MTPLRTASRPAVLLVLLGGLLSAACLQAADEITVTRTLFMPSTFYVGDSVDLRIQFQSLVGQLEAASPPKVDWGTIESMSLEPRGEDWELRLRFIPLATGTLTFPPLPLGSVALEGITAHVASVLEPSHREPAGARAQMALPSTWGLIVMQILILAALAAVLALVWRLGLPRLRHWLICRMERRPYRTLKNSLGVIRAAAADLSAKQAYDRMMHETRVYLADRLKIPAVSATRTELVDLLSRRVDNAEIVLVLSDLFRIADQVRFANEEASPAMILSHLGDLDFSLSGLEHELRLAERFNMGTREEVGHVVS